MVTRWAVLCRMALLSAGYAVAVSALAWASATPWHQIRRPGPTSFDELFTATAAAGAWLCLAWLTAGFTVSALAAAPGAVGRWCADVSARFTPAAVQRLACVVLGGVVVSGTGLGVPAAAATHSPHRPVATAAPLPDLDRPAGAATHTHAEAAGTSAGVQSPRSFAVTPSSGTMPSAPTKPSAEPSTPTKPSTTIKRPTSEAPSSDASVSRSLRVSGDVVVRPGDTLWGIAARHLPPGACNAGIAREWPRWYQANRRVVGADPDLIRPGQHLRPPANSAEEQKR